MNEAEDKQDEVAGSDLREQPQPKTKHKRNHVIIVVVIICAVIGIAGAGFWQWHETPSFCAAICHNMDEYLDTYSQPQGVAGHDKYGNDVSNTNAMMATLHSSNATTGKSEITCLDCHHAIIGEQVSEGLGYIAGNYYYPLYERVGDDLTHWWGDDVDGTTFCMNENCHAYLRGSDGLVDRDKLEATTIDLSFNPHAQHHEGIEMQCTTCHKGHRASVMECTGCHQHEDVEIPDGWLTKAQGDELMAQTF